jgi:hypothetical protein
MATAKAVPIFQFSHTDISDPNLALLNQQLRLIVERLNELSGVAGTILVGNTLDMQGNKIINQG